MPRLSFAGLSDPLRRPRYIIWTGVIVLTLFIVMALALGITSSRWFCAEGCHKVQDDTIISYAHSSHSNISCLACHMPVNASPVTFMFHKVEALGELYLTVTNKYELPLNAGDKLALDKDKMASTQCTQCHNMATRPVTPAAGIIIDHKAHADRGIQCTMCHNRTAHPEDFDLTLPGNKKHQDFMKMEACFRCHGLGAGAKAPGKCTACHTAEFELKPASHREKSFYPEGHAQLAQQDRKYCSMCHDAKTFCSKCHGLEMPHPKSFLKTHGALGKQNPVVCAKCHAQGTSGTLFCNACHHQGSDASKPWIPQHPAAVKVQGAQACFGCHNPTFCAQCHVATAGKQP
jgi:hypothetical protein